MKRRNATTRSTGETSSVRRGDRGYLMDQRFQRYLAIKKTERKEKAYGVTP